MTDDRALLVALANASVEFIVIGGVAAVAHGSARLTYDLDVVYARSPQNVARLVRALSPFKPYLRGAPPGLPFAFDEPTIQHGLNFTFTTSTGDIDILGEVIGGGRYEDLVAHSIELSVFGITCRCLDLAKLIEVKRAAGRPKDLEAIAELELIRDRTTK